MARQLLLSLALTLLGIMALLAVAGAQSDPGIMGAGSTFAAPLYQRWAQQYYEKTGTPINYYAIGSTGG